MAVTVDADARSLVAPQRRTVRFGGRDVPVVLPKLRDPRIHLAITTFTIITIGMVWLDFRLSIPQVAVALLACGLLDVVRTYRTQAVLAWPASALQTATSTALILRVTGMQAHDWWSFDGWYYFAGVATAGVLTKYYIRYQGRHIFNPSNVALVAAFLVFGADRIEPLDFWWGPFGWAMLAAYVVIVVGGVTLCRPPATAGHGGRLLRHVRGRRRRAGAARPVDHHPVVADADRRPALLVGTGHVTRDVDLPVLHDHRSAHDARRAPRPDRLRLRGRRGIDAAAGAMGDRVRHQGRLAQRIARRHRRTPVRRAPAGDPRRPRPAPPRRGGSSRPRQHVVAAASFVALVALAGSPNRSAAAADPPAPAVDFDIDPASLPAVSIDDDVAGLSAELATPAGAQELAAALAFNLQVEAEALATRDASLLTAVDHGQRLEDMREAIEGAAGGDIVVPSYAFDTLHLSIVYPGGFQSGANAGLAATGTVTLTTYSPDGQQTDRTEQPFATTFSLRNITSDRWLTTDTPSADKTD